MKKTNLRKMYDDDCPVLKVSSRLKDENWRKNKLKTWNHDRNEVLHVELDPNPVLNEMWFLTVNPFIRVSVFIAKLCERQYCWRVFDDFHGQKCIQFLDIHRCLFMCLHFSIGGHAYRRTARYRKVSISASLKSFFADHLH